MNISIHRGGKEIGGNAVIIEHEGCRILLDDGSPLDSSTVVEPIPGVDKDSVIPRVSAIFISHAHPDHFGRLRYAMPEIPVYINRGTGRLLNWYGASVPDYSWLLQWRREQQSKGRIVYYNDYEKIEIGPFRIIPIPVEHSSPFSNAFYITAGEENTFYTGDLRAHGRASWQWNRLLSFVRRHRIDNLICEGTAISRPKSELPINEFDIEDQLYSEFKSTKGLVLAQFSVTNLDRITDFIRACIKTRRKLVLDGGAVGLIYLVAGGKSASRRRGTARIPKIDDPIYRLFAGDNTKIYGIRNVVARVKRITENEINASPEKFVMIVRPRYMNDNAFNRINLSGAINIFSYWEGYRRMKTCNQKEFESWLASRSVETKQIHTSGHIHPVHLKEFINAAHPRNLLPIHTERPELFNIG